MGCLFTSSSRLQSKWRAKSYWMRLSGSNRFSSCLSFDSMLGAFRKWGIYWTWNGHLWSRIKVKNSTENSSDCQSLAKSGLQRCRCWPAQSHRRHLWRCGCRTWRGAFTILRIDRLYVESWWKLKIAVLPSPKMACKVLWVPFMSEKYSRWASEIQLSPVENGGKDPIIYRVSACFDHPRWCRISQPSTVCFNWTVSLMPLPKHGQVVREAVTLVSKFFLQNLQTLQRRCALQLDGTLASEKATGKPWETSKYLCFRTLWSIIKYLHYGPCSDSELGVTQRPPAFGGKLTWHLMFWAV